MASVEKSAALQIKVDTSGVSTATSELNNLRNSSEKVSKSNDNMGSSFKRLIAPIAGVVGATKLLRDAISQQRSYDRFVSVLTTITGSVDNAKNALSVLQRFANDTPFAIENLNESFVKLVNYGLDPSERALTSYGNTATALSRDITEMVNAVAGATTGNFESLKSFGIRAQNMGSQVAFSFQGTTTVVENSAKAIEGYLISLGENQFADTMANNLGKLDDSIAGLEEQWNLVLLNIMQSGLGDYIRDGFIGAAEALSEFNDMLASGEIASDLSTILGQFNAWAEDITATMNWISREYGEEINDISRNSSSVGNSILQAFINLPTNIRAAIQILVVELSNKLQTMYLMGVKYKDKVTSLFSLDRSFIDADREYNIAVARIDYALEESRNAIFKNRDDTIKANREKLNSSDELTKQYKREREALKGTDQLAKYRIQGENSGVASGRGGKTKDELKELQKSLMTEKETIENAYNERLAIVNKYTAAESELRASLTNKITEERDKQLEKLGTYGNSELESLRQSLLTQEETIRESYQRGVNIVKQNTDEESEARRTLLEQLKSDYDKSMADFRQSERDKLYEGLITEEQQLLQSYERRKQLIMESTQVTEEERQALLDRLRTDYEQKQMQQEIETQQVFLEGFSSLFEGMAGIAKSFGSEQSTAYRVLFATAKAFSVASTTLSMYVAMSKAMELPFPANWTEYAKAASLGANLISSVGGTNFSGAYDGGGIIPSGQFGLVGEYGPELVTGPAHVTGRRKTAQELANMDNRPQVNINVTNNSNAQVTATQEENGDISILVEQVSSSVAEDIRSGKGIISEALEGVYAGVRRGAA